MDQNISSKLNILELHATLEYAGGQRNMVTFAKYLRKDIFSVAVATIFGGGPLENVLKKLGIPIFIGDGTAERVLNIVKENHIDVLHIHRSGGAVPIETKIICGAKVINPKIVIIEKNVFGKYDPSLDDIIDCSFFQSMMHINERYLLASGKDFDFDTMKVLYNHIDETEFLEYSCSKKEIEDYKIQLGIALDDFVVGKVGRNALEKWSDLIIDCVPYLAKTTKKFKIILIGAPPSRVNRINNSPYKQFFCIVPETSDQKIIHRFYQTIDVLAHCSKIGECNGNTINEAFFWKKPVITNSTPKKDNGQLEQVVHNHNGYIANTPPSFAAALLALSANSNLRNTFGENGYTQTKLINNPEQNTRQVEKCIIDKMSKKSVVIPLLLQQEYAKIQYSPTEEEIKKYKEEYRSRLKDDYRKLTIIETAKLVLRLPVSWYYKIKDLLEHKMSYYGSKK